MKEVGAQPENTMLGNTETYRNVTSLRFEILTGIVDFKKNSQFMREFYRFLRFNLVTALFGDSK
jgi:hypothetical protein